jgi:hypothetical protein
MSDYKNMISNGRVDILQPNTNNLFALYDKIPAVQCTTLQNPTEGLWDETLLSKTFFSKENIQIIQNGIRAGVYNKSNGEYIIGQQDCDSLKIIMRSIFLQNATNQITNIRGQVEKLNKMVLNYCVYKVFGEATGYLKYLKDASTMYVPIAPPVLSYTNDKQLELKSFF